MTNDRGNPSHPPVVTQAAYQSELDKLRARRFLTTTSLSHRRWLPGQPAKVGFMPNGSAFGSGVPAAGNTHQVAQRLAPESRIVYADRDPTVAQHARSLLGSTREGKTDYLHAGLRDPEGILAGAARTLDLTRSVGVLLIAVLHFIPDAGPGARGGRVCPAKQGRH